MRHLIQAVSLAVALAGTAAAYAQTSITAQPTTTTRQEARSQFSQREATHKAELDAERAAAPSKLAAREEQRRRFSEREALHKARLDAERAAAPGKLAAREAERARYATLERERHSHMKRP